MKNPGLALILTMALAAAALNASAETRMKEDLEVENPCVEAVLAGQFGSQLARLKVQTDALLQALVDDSQTVASPAAMWFLGRNMAFLERSRKPEWTPNIACLTRIDQLTRNTRMVVRVYAALLKGDAEFDIEKLANKAALDALPQLLVQAQALEKTVELIADSFKQRED